MIIFGNSRINQIDDAQRERLFSITGRCVHHLKTVQPFFDDVVGGDKKFEIRKNDRDFQLNEILFLHEFENSQYTGKFAVFRVIYLLDEQYGDLSRFGITKGFCLLGIEPLAYSLELDL